MLILAYAFGFQSYSILCVFLLLFLFCGNFVRTAIKNSEGINKQNEAIGSIMKNQELSESFPRCLEASGSIRKAQHQNINKQNTVALKPQVDYEISTVKKHCQLLSALVIADKTQLKTSDEHKYSNIQII